MPGAFDQSLIYPMTKRLQAALMISLTAISFSSIVFQSSAALAQSGQTVGAIASTTDDSGRKIYVNDGPSGGERSSSHSASYSARSRTSSSSRSPLVYWSSTEHRFKPVPTSGAVMRAARSAASEVDTYLGGSRSRSTTSFSHPSFTQAEINAAIDEAAARHHVDPSLVRSVVKVESNFNPNAVSSKGAMGLMQLMPATARSLNLANPFDPAQNVEAGVRHLRSLLDSYGGNVTLSLAAYNAGAGAVARSAGVPHYKETQEYVRRITNLYGGRTDIAPHFMGRAIHPLVHEPVRVERDARGVLYISNTD
jgi:hypothetical protein